MGELLRMAINPLGNQLSTSFQLFTVNYNDWIDLYHVTFEDHNFGFLFVYLEPIDCAVFSKHGD